MVQNLAVDFNTCFLSCGLAEHTYKMANVSAGSSSKGHLVDEMYLLYAIVGFFYILRHTMRLLFYSLTGWL